MVEKIRWTERDLREYSRLAEKVSDSIRMGTDLLTAQEIRRYDRLLPKYLQSLKDLKHTKQKDVSNSLFDKHIAIVASHGRAVYQWLNESKT